MEYKEEELVRAPAFRPWIERPEIEVFEVTFIETRSDLVYKKALKEIGFWFVGRSTARGTGQ